MADFGNVKVDTEELLAKADKSWLQIRSYQDCLNKIRQEVDGSASYWQGKAGDMYREVLKKQMQIVEGALEEYAEYPKELLAYAGIYSETIANTEELAQSVSDLKMF